MSRRLLLAVLALAAGVAGCDDDVAVPTVSMNPMADSADQVLFGVRHNVTDAGLLRAKLVSDTGFIFDDGTRIELLDVDLTFFTTSGARDAVLTAAEGTYRTRVGSMEARRNVLVVAEDGRRLTTQQLRYEPNRNQISSDSAFVLTEPNGRRLSGVGFVSDPDMKNIRILARTGGEAGVITDPAAPAARPSSGGSIVPPPVSPPAGP